MGVRLGVKTTGCSGLASPAGIRRRSVARRPGLRRTWREGDGDPKSLAYLDGTELDFVREGLNEGFRFNNPRERDRVVAANRSASDVDAVNLQSCWRRF